MIYAVTGSAGDIGKAICAHLEAQGHTVVRGTRENCDVLHQDSVVQFFEKLWEQHRRLDGLVNAVGAPGCIGPSVGVPLSKFREVLAVHITGMFTACVSAFPYMSGNFKTPEKVGAIVNLSSIHSIATYPQRAAYAAATAGVVGMSKALAIEWAPRGVRVNCVAPGQVLETRRTQNIDSPQVRSRSPSGRLVDLSSVAKAVEFLLSPGTQITGHNLVVDDGWTSSSFWSHDS